MYKLIIRNDKNYSVVSTPSIDVIRMIIKHFLLNYGEIDFVKILVIE